jgi:hypothetical protein
LIERVDVELAGLAREFVLGEDSDRHVGDNINSIVEENLQVVVPKIGVVSTLAGKSAARLRSVARTRADETVCNVL